VIGESGVEYLGFRKRYKISRDDVNIVGVAEYAPIHKDVIGVVGRGRKMRWIYITTKSVMSSMDEIRENADGFIVANYRKKIIIELLKYRKNGIKGL